MTTTTTGTTQTFTSVITAAPSTTTVYTTSTSTTTITSASNAPTGLTPFYLQISPDNNPGAGWGLSDPQTHMTDNYYAQSQREVYELNSAGQLYSVTKNAWYYGLNGATSGKLFWSTSQAQGNATFAATPVNDALNRLQLFMHVSTTNTANRVFCVSTVASNDANTATGFHVNFYPPGSTLPASCQLTYLYLYPVGNG